MFYNPANGLGNRTGADAQLPQNILAPSQKHPTRAPPNPGGGGALGGLPGQQVASATLPEALSREPSGRLEFLLRRYGII